MKSSLTPELFSQAQIDFLRCIGVRVVYCGSNQSVFNDAADFANGRVRMFADGLRKLLLHDEAKTGPGLPPDGTCEMCNGVGFYISLPGDVISPCPGCDGVRIRTTGVPGQRDAGAPCIEFRPGTPRDGDCDGDGHYLCDQCSKHSTRLTAEAVDSGSNDSAPVDGDGEHG
jgi:hypothetical protein